MVENIKYKYLLEYIKRLGSVAVAFSGGVDSTFLLRAAKEALGDKVVAITIVSPYIPKWEVEEAIEITKNMNIMHKFIEVPILEEIRTNPKERCYLCKKNIFSMIIEEAREQNINFVLDGTNADDTKDYRPGIRALKELNIKSPLLENNLTKEDIRILSKELGLQTWDKPAYACLLSRIPYDEEIKIEELNKIERSEKYLMSLGFKGVRVRSHRDLARIELQKKDIMKVFNDKLMEPISKELKSFGYKYVTLDLEGYKMGSLN